MTAPLHPRPRRGPQAWLVGALVALGALALAGCTGGSGWVEGAWLDVPDCRGPGASSRFEPFDMAIHFLAVDREGEGAQLRMTDSASRRLPGDQLAVVLDAWPAIDEELRANGEARRLVGEGGVEAGLTLLGRCAHPSASLRAVSGELVLTSFGVARGDRVTGAMRFHVADRRTGLAVGEDFRAEFDFAVEPGRPYLPFSPSAP